jgi:hypothetical protein
MLINPFQQVDVNKVANAHYILIFSQAMSEGRAVSSWYTLLANADGEQSL